MQLMQITFLVSNLEKIDVLLLMVSITKLVQNKILMEGVLTKLRKRGFKPYYNISVSPNDGGIALGQAYAAMQQILTEY